MKRTPRALFSCRWTAILLLAPVLLAGSVRAGAARDGKDQGGVRPKGKVLAPVSERFAAAEVQETPDFQKHVVPLLGRLGCNGRACHGSFQGRGGFRLSLFGYDFQADREALLDGRVDLDEPRDSLILRKPTNADLHEGGLRYEEGGWQHHLLRRWIEAGAKFDKTQVHELVDLEITPPEVIFDPPADAKGAKQGPPAKNDKGKKDKGKKDKGKKDKGKKDKGKKDKAKKEKTDAPAPPTVQLKVVAVWDDGVREDVTPLCRFQVNDDQIAAVDEHGLVTAGERGDTHVVVFYDNGVVPVPVLRPVSDRAGSNYPHVPTPTRIDELVVDKLRKLGVVPSELTTDAEFLRRVRLDLTGTLPSADEVRSFLADPSPDKRKKKIDELLKTTSYAAWWTTRLCDYTGNNDDQLVNATAMRGEASGEWYDWIHRRVAENVPYDELVAGIVVSSSRRPGEDYLEYCREMSKLYHPDSDAEFADRSSMPHYWARRDFNEPEARAIGFAYAFLGIRIQCAQCHKHPFDQWSKDDFHQFKNFFTRVTASRNRPRREDRKAYDKLLADLGLKGKRGGQLRRELPKLLKKGKTVPFPEVYAEPPKSRNGKPAGPAEAKLLGGDVVNLHECDDPRAPLMKWLRDPDNPYFARAFVNRVWAAYFGRGIVDPPDDLSLANPPSNGPLLDYLAEGFIDSGFDMKWLHREIANSRTYQLSVRPNATNRGDRRNFSHALPRRLPAEVLYDALAAATASDDEVAAMHADGDDRAIGIAGTKAGRAEYALTVFGRSTRETNCDCDRTSAPSLLQTVYLQNDEEVLRMLEPRKGSWLQQVAGDVNLDQLADAKNTDAKKKNTKGELLADLVEEAYLRTLSRYPRDEELKRSVQYLSEGDDPAGGLEDVLWALLNTKEFMVNH